jgi:hypothetical protein
MKIYDRSALEKLYNACITDNINLEIGIYLRNGDSMEYIPPTRPLYGNRDYKALFKLSNIGIAIDFKDVQLRVKKSEDTLPINLYKELGQEPVERVDFTDIPWLRSPDGGRRTPTEAYRTVYFRPEGEITADERDKLFRCGVYATVVPQGQHWYWADQAEFAAPSLDIPNTLNFGDVSFTRTLTKTLELGNIGEGDLTITEIVLGESSDFNIKNGLSLPCTISPGQKVSLKVEFAPSSLGLKRVTLTIKSTDPVNPEASISLVGMGVHSFRALSPEIDFGEVLVKTTSIPGLLELINDGREDVQVADIQIDVQIPGTHASDVCFSCRPSPPFSVRAESSTRLDIVFSPTMIGSRTGTLTVVSDYSMNPEITLKGEAVHWLTAPSGINFGEVPVNDVVREQITIKNNSPSSCKITRLDITGNPQAKVEFNIHSFVISFPYTLERNHSLDLLAQAKPTGLGVQEKTLIIYYGSTDGTVSERLRVNLRVKGTRR